jgi:two-component system, chemotaxis family, chemotaxis protein CheY
VGALGNLLVTVTPRPPRTLDLANMSVLAIDDQPFFRALLVEVLRSIGITNVAVGEDGIAGLKLFEERKPDLVITDWMMPNLDGVAFTQKIRSHPIEARRQTPILLVTAINQRSKIEFARACGIDEFILKPISAKSIVDRLREVIERPRPFVNLRTYAGPCRRRRADPYFAGPYRRFDDPIEIEDDGDKLEQGLISIVRQGIGHIEKLSDGLSRGLGNVKPIHMAVMEMQGVAEDLADKELEQVCELLLSYVVVMNTTRKVVPGIIHAHLKAMEALIDTPKNQKAPREEVVAGLQRLLRRPKAA